MLTSGWQISEATEDVAAEQYQGGIVELENLKAVSGTPVWAVGEPQKSLPIKPTQGGAVELAQTGAPSSAAERGPAESLGLSRGVKNFVAVFLVLVFGIIIFVVAMRDSAAGNLTFGKLVEDIGLLLTGLVGGTLLKLRR